MPAGTAAVLAAGRGLDGRLAPGAPAGPAGPEGWVWAWSWPVRGMCGMELFGMGSGSSDPALVVAFGGQDETGRDGSGDAGACACGCCGACHRVPADGGAGGSAGSRAGGLVGRPAFVIGPVASGRGPAPKPGPGGGSGRIAGSARNAWVGPQRRAGPDRELLGELAAQGGDLHLAVGDGPGDLAERRVGGLPVVAEQRGRRPHQRHVGRGDLVQIDRPVIGLSWVKLAAAAHRYGNDADQDDGSDSEQDHGHRRNRAMLQP